MSPRTQRVCAWSGSVAMIIAGIGMFGSGLFPPVSPHSSPRAVAHFYGAHPTRMRAGLLLAFLGFGLWGPWVAGISTQMRRIKNLSPVLATTQLVAGAASWVFLLMPLLIFSAAAFRPTRDAAVLQGINDIGWFTFIMAIVPFIVQALVIGFATLQDRSDRPIFPRWFGYLNIWVAIIEVPGGLLTFFQTGPFDWRGLLALWLPFAAFATWIFSISYVLDVAIRREARELDRAPARPVRAPRQPSARAAI
jgi:hypothetical protein